MDFEEIKKHFNIKKDYGNNFTAICPAHPDREASLHVKHDENQGKTILKCFAGCETEEICEAAGLKVSDLFDKGLSQENQKSGWDITSVYKYLDEDENLLFEKIRYKTKKNSKNFTQRRYVYDATVWGLDSGTYYETFPGSNEWSKKKRNNAKNKEFPTCEPILYNLPDLINGVKNNQVIYICEGEKDVDNLLKLGLVATCNFDGASKSSQNPKWRDSYNKYFKDATVILIPDNDDPGRAHMNNIAENLCNFAKSIKIVNLNDVAEKEDISDYLQKHTLKEFMELVEAAPQWSKADLFKFNLTDSGNANRVVAVYGDNIKYNHTDCYWYLWDGKRYKIDNLGEMVENVKNVSTIFQTQAIEQDKKNEDKSKTLTKYALKLENIDFIKKCLNSAQSIPSIRTQSTDFDTDTNLLNCINGVLNIETFEFLEHDKKYLQTLISGVEYDPKVKCPNFESSLDWIFPDAATRRELQKAYGYSLGGGLEYQVYFILSGKGENGKSTIMDPLKDLMEEYHSSLNSRSLEPRKDNTAASSDLAKLVNSRLVVASEPSEGQRLDDGMIKTLAVGEEVNARFMRNNEFTYKPAFKLWIPTNNLPYITNTEYGFWRRMIIFPCKNKPKNKIIDFYANYIKLKELPGILNWALEGRKLLKKEGFILSDEMEDALRQYKAKVNPIEEFVLQCCVKSTYEKIETIVLLSAYNVWSDEEGYSEFKIRGFRDRLINMGYEVRTSTGNKSYIFGLNIKNGLNFKNQYTFRVSRRDILEQENRAKVQIVQGKLNFS